jgi:hypothetical protein
VSLRFRLRDTNGAVVDAWQRHFADCADVAVSAGDIFHEPADAIMSPANSFGFMDWGIDRVCYSYQLPWHLGAHE